MVLSEIQLVLDFVAIGNDGFMVLVMAFHKQSCITVYWCMVALKPILSNLAMGVFFMIKATVLKFYTHK